MRSLGVVLLLVGILGFVYSGDQARRYEPVPEASTVVEMTRYPAGRWELARYACALGAGLGLLLALFPKGR